MQTKTIYISLMAMWFTFFRRVQARQVAYGDHPPLLQLLEMWIIILLPPRILTRVKKVDL